MVVFIQADEGRSDFLYKLRVTVMKDEKEKEKEKEKEGAYI